MTDAVKIEPSAKDALQAIANLPLPDTPEGQAAQEEAFRSVEALFNTPPTIHCQSSPDAVKIEPVGYHYRYKEPRSKREAEWLECPNTPDYDPNVYEIRQIYGPDAMDRIKELEAKLAEAMEVVNFLHACLDSGCTPSGLAIANEKVRALTGGK